MSSPLVDMVPALQRAIAVPGGFDELFPDAIEADLVGIIADAIAEAQLDGFMRSYEVDPVDGVVEPAISNGGYPNAYGALVLLYASYQLLRNEVMNRKTHVRYQAGSAIFEEDQTASMLNELMRQARKRLEELRERAERGEMDDSGAFVLDMHFIRATTDYGLGVHPLEAWGY